MDDRSDTSRNISINATARARRAASHAAMFKQDHNQCNTARRGRISCDPKQYRAQPSSLQASRHKAENRNVTALPSRVGKDDD